MQDAREISRRLLEQAVPRRKSGRAQPRGTQTIKEQAWKEAVAHLLVARGSATLARRGDADAIAGRYGSPVESAVHHRRHVRRPLLSIAGSQLETVSLRRAGVLVAESSYRSSRSSFLFSNFRRAQGCRRTRATSVERAQDDRCDRPGAAEALLKRIEKPLSCHGLPKGLSGVSGAKVFFKSPI